jgi:hypothetical protein
VGGLGPEVDAPGGGDLGPPGGAGGEQLVAPGTEAGLQAGHELQRRGREDLLAALDRRTFHAHVHHRGPPRPAREAGILSPWPP